MEDYSVHRPVVAGAEDVNYGIWLEFHKPQARRPHCRGAPRRMQEMQEMSARKLSTGFTLIELLVVIAIIALLVSILLPSLSAAREMARGTVCLSNCRRLTIAMNLYLQTSDEVFPPDRLRDRSAYIEIGSYKRYRPRWIWYLNEGAGPVIDPRNYSSEAEFNKALEMDNDYFICPSLRSNKHARSIRNGAYGMNFQYISNSRNEGPNGRPANFPNKISRIDMPSSCIAFGDSRGGGKPGEYRLHAYLIDPPKMALSRNARTFSPKSPKIGPLKYSPAEARHLDRANVGFLDGHAEQLTYEQLGYAVDPKTDAPVEKSNRQVGGPGDNTLWAGTGRDEP
jgi:prepilin-type N-terminal cleavage/methylation domain-containing protein/prepilin-type processing-associated H-X9-DG protein